MGQELTPYTLRTPELPEMEPSTLDSDELSGMGVWFVFPSVDLTENVDTVEAWYEHRNDVVLVASGQTAKKRWAYIIMEWEGSAVDRLFIDILRTDETIIAYGVYGVQA